MATREEHYQAAEKYLESALAVSAAGSDKLLNPSVIAVLNQNITHQLAIAQIHATLASVIVEPEEPQ
jgi:hypothetical protein